MPWRGICVQASGEFGGTWGFAWTGSDGTYTVSGLAAGDYPVEFWDCNEPAFYASEYYNDMTPWSAATLVTVTAGVDSPGIDAALSLKTGFSGRIYDERTGLALREGWRFPRVTAHSTSLGSYDATANEWSTPR